MKQLLILFLSCLLLNPCFGGVDFDGSDDRIDLSTGLAFNVATISAWINVNNTADIKNIVGKRDNLPGSYILRVTSSEVAAAFWRNFSGTFTNTGSTNLTGVEHHILMTIDDVTDRKIGIYVDGALDSGGLTTTSGTTATTSNEVNIGKQNIGGFERFFDGSITEVAIWNTVLTVEEISLLASAKVKGMPLQIQPSNLQGYWPLDDQPDGTSFDGDTAVNRSGNSNNGTGDDGGNNTGLTAKAEEILSYQ